MKESIERVVLSIGCAAKAARSRLRHTNILGLCLNCSSYPKGTGGGILVIPLNFIQLWQNWMEGAVSTSSPDRPLQGLGGNGETRAPAKLF